VQADLNSSDRFKRSFAETQYLAVLVYQQPEKARQRLEAIYRGILSQPTEIVRMESLLEILAAPIGPYLLNYARSLGYWTRGKHKDARFYLKNLPRDNNQIVIAGSHFPLPQNLQTRWTRREFFRLLGLTILGGGAARFAWLLRQTQLPGINPTDILQQAQLTPFPINAVTVNQRGQVIRTQALNPSAFAQPLGSQVRPLEMVAIPGGEFIMGSPPTERGHRDEEAPQRRVKVPPFYLGKYPVTQAQWRAIATRPKIPEDLNPEPSYLRGDDDLPVHSVNWHEAVEFCERLTQLVGGGVRYRLPSEAEWEYACRSGGTTPFHFGETITGNLANYNSSQRFAAEAPVTRREKTTPVGQFSPNAFGLYDMHGQVWEWCEDDWHDNYENAPVDGSAWLNKNNSQQAKCLRGGSWINYPEDCRSANRFNDLRVVRFDVSGFRVMCWSGRS
jgi:formylglycine-generating enzyme required for sulfatase activity